MIGAVNGDDFFKKTHSFIPDVTIRALKTNCNACRPLKQLLAQFLSRQPGEVAAAVRTTVAVTGVTTHPAAGNVLPSLATAQLNFRYLPGLCLFTFGFDAEILPASLLHAGAIPYVFLSEAHSSASYVHASLMDIKWKSSSSLLVCLCQEYS